MRRVLALFGGLALVVSLMVAAPATARGPSRMRVVPGDGTAAPSFVTRIEATPRSGRPADVALDHLRAHPARYRIASPEDQLTELDVVRDGNTATVRFGQVFQGVPVFGAQYLVHMREESGGQQVTSVNGHFFTELDTSVRPRVSAPSARRLAVGRQRMAVDRVDSHGLVVLPNDEGVPAWHFTVWGHRWKTPVKQQVFVNARTGAQVLSYNDLQHAGPVAGTGIDAHGVNRPLNVFERDDGDFEMRDQVRQFQGGPTGELLTHDALGADGNVFVPTDDTLARSDTSTFSGQHSDSGAVDAHWGSGQVFEFYEDLGRNSIDGAGMDIVSVVNASDFGGAPMYNAFWDGIKMVMTYGNPEPGPTGEVHPLSADLDVVAHELTHGVTQFTANLVYVNQSGAMNEAYSDYFGNAIDVTASGTPMSATGAGEIGEDLCKVPEPANWVCPLRDLNDGRTTDDFVFHLVDFDTGGVHLNSTIYAGALWDVRENLDPALADQIAYKALSEFHTPLDDFVDGRNAVLAAADALGVAPADRAEVVAAFDGKGIVEGWDSIGSSDATSLLENVAPLGFFSFSSPQVSGNRFVIGNFDPIDGICCDSAQIYVGNVDGTGTIEQVSDPGADPTTFNDEQPDLSGERAVWSHLTEGPEGFDVDLQLRRLGGGLSVPAEGPGFQWFSSIDGELLAWQNLTNQTDIRARFLGKKVRRVTRTPGEEFMPATAGNTVAWYDVGKFNRAPRIGIKNLKTGKKATIKGPNPNAILGPPALNNRFVFWLQDNNGDGFAGVMRAKHNGKNKKVLLRETSNFAPVSAGLAPPGVPAANARFVVYSDEFGYALESSPDFPRNLVGRDVWMLPVNGGKPKLLTCNVGDQAYPGLGTGRRTVWLDSSQGRTDLMTRPRPRTTCPG